MQLKITGDVAFCQCLGGLTRRPERVRYSHACCGLYTCGQGSVSTGGDEARADSSTKVSPVAPGGEGGVCEAAESVFVQLSDGEGVRLLSGMFGRGITGAGVSAGGYGPSRVGGSSLSISGVSILVRLADYGEEDSGELSHLFVFLLRQMLL